MIEYPNNLFGEAEEPGEAYAVRSVLDQLLQDAKLYRQGNDFKELLDFVARLRNIAPFNGMLLQIQKPGLTYAASIYDWWERFKRRPKEGARPLLILWPFGPVALVYDVMDTEGEPLPQDVASFFAIGKIDASRIASFEDLLKRKNVHWTWVDAGDSKAGQIRVVKPANGTDEPAVYRMQVNRNHPPATQFATLAHELGHLCLGHLGADARLGIPQRDTFGHEKVELEAESVAYIVCKRNDVKPKSETYLSNFVNHRSTVDDLDVYQITRAAGQVESLLDIAGHTKMPQPNRRRRCRKK